MGMYDDIERSAAANERAGNVHPSDPVDTSEPMPIRSIKLSDSEKKGLTRADIILAERGEFLAPSQDRALRTDTTGKTYIVDHDGEGSWYNPRQLAEKKARDKEFDRAGRSCFVATVVYLSVTAPQVEALRDYRDNVLMKSSVGRAFVDFYYSGAGEKTADFIKRQLPSTIPLIRRGLDRLVSCHHSHKNKV